MLRAVLIFTVIFSSFTLNLIANNPTDYDSEKIYVGEDSILVQGQDILICLGDAWARTEALRSDASGLYVVYDDLSDLESNASQPKKWKCPYCNHWSEYGQKCQNKNCPTNQWKD